MSVDLFVVRQPRSITHAEASVALNALCETFGDVKFWADDENALEGDLHFWKVPRVSIGFDEPPPDEATDENDPWEAPHLIISSRSGAWPWIAFTAIELARRLEGRVYDPQEGALQDSLEPPQSINILRGLHALDLAERKPELVVDYSATVPAPNGGQAELERTVLAIGKASMVLGDAPLPTLGPKHVSFSHHVPLSETSRVSVSCHSRNQGVGITVTGPARNAKVTAFTKALAAELGIAWRKIEQYR